ncbi:MAG: hypothetical protein ABL911_09520 [Gallionella sp.]
MRKKILSHPAVLIAAMILPTIASAASAPDTPSIVAQNNQSGITWSASTGLGYDGNVYQAPRATYVDYAALPAGSNPTVTPQAKSGFFVPYDIKLSMAKSRDQDNKLLGSAIADGTFYFGGLSNANEYSAGLSGGLEHVLARKGKSENTLTAGAFIKKRKQVYVDHDSGTNKTTVGGSNISDRYSYMSMGIEAEYKYKISNIDYGFNGQYALNDYDDPIVVSQLDHTYYTLGADASIPITSEAKLNLSLNHFVRDYSDRHSRNAQGVYLNANPLLRYTYNAFGATLRSRLSPEWLVYLDFDHTRRADNYVSYGNSSENRYGTRLIYEQGSIKTRLALHHWKQNYPNGFAFDVAGRGAKKYSGNVLKAKVEWAQTKATALWSELVYTAQNATDLRYDYNRKQIMAGVSWAY